MFIKLKLKLIISPHTKYIIINNCINESTKMLNPWCCCKKKTINANPISTLMMIALLWLRRNAFVLCRTLSVWCMFNIKVPSCSLCHRKLCMGENSEKNMYLHMQIKFLWCDLLVVDAHQTTCKLVAVIWM